MTERERVLVADDDPLIQRLVRTHLDRAGFRVLTAADGEAAVDTAAAEQPDLIVLDLMLLEPDVEHPTHILSEPGYGYVLDCPGAE